MEKFTRFLISKKYYVLGTTLLLLILSIVLLTKVGINSDVTKYLPDDIHSVVGLNVLEDEFNIEETENTGQVFINDVTVNEVVAYKQQIKQVTGVKSVVWLDDFVDVSVDLSFYPNELVSKYYTLDKALLYVQFMEPGYSDITIDAIKEIKNIVSDSIVIGEATDTSDSVFTLDMYIGIALAFILMIIFLIICSNSLFEVVLFLITIGVAIIINLGTNIMYGEISDITLATAAILQLAISMDYSIVLFHTFKEERKHTDNLEEAMIKSVKKSFKTITSSSVTTIVGFLALIFMSYSLGADMGLVLAKGIILSLLAVLILLPILILLSVKLIDKTTHKQILPSLVKPQKFFGSIFRYFLLIILLALTFFGFHGQNNNEFTYGSKLYTFNELKVREYFEEMNTSVLLLPKDNPTSEKEVSLEISALHNVDSVQGIYLIVDPLTPVEYIPIELTSVFLSDNYSRIFIDIKGPLEGDETFETIKEIRDIANNHYDEEIYLVGRSSSLYDIKNVTSNDLLIVFTISIIAVFIVLIIAFKSIWIPLILLFVIETSIWVNMSIPYYTGSTLNFIGYIIVMSIQLGATIDYAILLTHHYQEGRKNLSAKEAAIYSIKRDGTAVLTSMIVLTTAGITLGLTVTNLQTSELGMLIGRGALISGIMTLIFVPQLLIIFDKLIYKTKKSKRN